MSCSKYLDGVLTFLEGWGDPNPAVVIDSHSGGQVKLGDCSLSTRAQNKLWCTSTKKTAKSEVAP